jgi:probable H4MPT-linked C1 transfer pathway protein
MSISVLGLDIGGANLKAAWYSPEKGLPTAAVSRPFALWKNPGDLVRQLSDVAEAFPQADLTAVTMTAELCDCFASKRQGVHAILDAVTATFTGPVRLWTIQERFVDRATARVHPLPLASANFLALATFAGRFARTAGTALLMDVGSTTTDLIPLEAGRPVPRERCDAKRLRSGELVYTGVRRTPVCALIQEGIAAEVFATTLDVYLVLGKLTEPCGARGSYEPDYPTADGGPPTREGADLRLARMLGADLETSKPEERLRLAELAAARQCHLIGAALGRVLRHLPATPEIVIIAGEGGFLANAVLASHDTLRTCTTVFLREILGAAISQAACAYAVAVLAAEQGTGVVPL